jgi:PAS domain S-box-containing protein
MYNVDLRKYLIYKEKLDLNKISDFTIETRFIHKNRSKVWTAMSVSLVKNIKNKYYTFQFIDITSRKKIEHENKLLLDETIISTSCS